MSNERKVIIAIVAIVAAMLAFRVWWYWPERIMVGGLLEYIEVRGGDYCLMPKVNVRTSSIVNLTTFGGYAPKRHFEYKGLLDGKESKYVKVNNHHHYIEYALKRGRMRFHSEYDEESGIHEWCELFPTELYIDDFIRKDISVNFNIEDNKYKVYIPNKNDGTYMTIYANRTKISKIIWQAY